MRGEGNLYWRNGVAWARVQVRGREIRRSLRTRSVGEARKRLKEFLAEAEHFAWRGEARHSWKEAVVEWAAEAHRTLKPATRRRYLVSLGRVRGVLDELMVEDVSPASIARLARRPGVTNATRRRDLTAVSAVLSWCVGRGWREDNPARMWDRGVIRERRDPIRLPEEAAIDAAVALAVPGLAALIRFAQYTGMRQEEVASLTWAQIDLARGAAMLTATKTGRPRAVPLDDRALGTIAGTPQRLGCPWVFWHGAGERFRNVASRFAHLTARAAALARPAGSPAPARFRFHDLRHLFAVDYLRRGGSIYRVQQILGHSSIRTTELYLAYLTPEEQERAKAAEGQSA